MAYEVKKIHLHAFEQFVSNPDFNWADYFVWGDGRDIAFASYSPDSKSGEYDRYALLFFQGIGGEVFCKQDEIEQKVREILADAPSDYNPPCAIHEDSHPSFIDSFVKGFPEIVARCSDPKFNDAPRPVNWETYSRAIREIVDITARGSK